MAPKPKQRPSQGPDTPQQQDSKDNIQQAAASRLLAYKPAAWDHWRTDRSEQHTAAMIRNIQGDLKQASPGPMSLLEQEGILVQPQHYSAWDRYPQHTLRSRKASQCQGGSVTSCPQPRAELVLVCCCTVAVFPERQSPGKHSHASSPGQSGTSRWVCTHHDKCPKNDLHGFPTRCKATMLPINTGVWGETACWLPYGNLLLHCFQTERLSSRNLECK